MREILEEIYGEFFAICQSGKLNAVLNYGPDFVSKFELLLSTAFAIEEKIGDKKRIEKIADIYCKLSKRNLNIVEIKNEDINAASILELINYFNVSLRNIEKIKIEPLKLTSDAEIEAEIEKSDSYVALNAAISPIQPEFQENPTINNPPNQMSDVNGRVIANMQEQTERMKNNWANFNPFFEIPKYALTIKKIIAALLTCFLFFGVFFDIALTGFQLANPAVFKIDNPNNVWMSCAISAFIFALILGIIIFFFGKKYHSIKEKYEFPLLMAIVAGLFVIWYGFYIPITDLIYITVTLPTPSVHLHQTEIVIAMAVMEIVFATLIIGCLIYGFVKRPIIDQSKIERFIIDQQGSFKNNLQSSYTTSKTDDFRPIDEETTGEKADNSSQNTNFTYENEEANEESKKTNKK